MVATAPIMEVTGVGPIKLVEAVNDVLAGMAVHNVKQDHDAMWVSYIHQFLQVFRRPIATERRQSM